MNEEKDLATEIEKRDFGVQTIHIKVAHAST
jgi:hypothetical protein